MRKILFGAGAFLSFALAASAANAIGGGPTPASASPYAILEPQTVAPVTQTIAPQAAEEGRAVFEGRRAHCPRGDRTCQRHTERKRAPWGEQ
jgi:hypothetical protein